MPGARSPADGPNSGEEFRQQLLEPAFMAAREARERLLVDLDGTEGYATSFLDEAFGGLARKFGADAVLNVLQFKSDDELYLIEDIREYILA